MIKRMFPILLMAVFGFLFVSSVQAEETTYPAGSLLALNKTGSAVYYIGEDARKYIFPEEKTYFTWYDDFSKVIKVDPIELDKYEDGGIMPYRPGVLLITHPNTNNVYAVEPNGLLRKIVSEEAAKNLYGENWASTVRDVIPGYFASTYKMGSDLSDKLPNGTLVKEQGKDDIYYVYDGSRRKFYDATAFDENGFRQKDIMTVASLAKYEYGRTIKGKEENLSHFTKDKAFKYSNMELYYTINSDFGGSIAIVFPTSTKPFEVRNVLIKGAGNLRLDYKSNQYALKEGETSYFTLYYQAPFVVDMSESYMKVVSNNFRSETPIEIDLRDWVLWDIAEDKQIINIHGQTFK